MNFSLYCLVFVQFISAFADNAILFTIVAMVLKSGGHPSWYVPALQSVFLLSYVLLAPWVGMIADRYAKPLVLIWANMLKALGAVLILIDWDPLFAYAIVGAGAAVYSPAKYGLLPELARHDQLVKANSWVEGATIASILLGTLSGAKLADYSVSWALMGIVGLYLISALATLLMRPGSQAGAWEPGVAWESASKSHGFLQMMAKTKTLLSESKALLVLFGLSFFWAIAACLRVILVAWAPQVLQAQTASDVAELTLFMAIGIVIGSAAAARLISLEKLQRTRFAAYAMGLFLIAFSFAQSVWPARAALLAIGTAAGIFIVPMNATLQEIGHKTIGSGSAVAIQNLLQNVAMLLAVGGWTLAAGQGVDPVMAILTLGVLVVSVCFVFSGFLLNRRRRRI